MKFSILNLKVNHILLTVVIILSLFLLFFKISKPEIVRWDEYTNYRVIEDTITSENWLELKYNDSETGEFFEKPPLWYWIAIGSSKVFGVNNFSVRFPTAVFGLLLILTIIAIGWRNSSLRTGLISGLAVLGTSHLFINTTEIFSTHTLRSADIDALQLFLIMLSILFFLEYFKNKNDKNNENEGEIPESRLHFFEFFNKYLVIAFLSSSLATLTKGPFGLLPIILFFGFQGIQVIIGVWKKENVKKLIFDIIKQIALAITILLTTVGIWHLFMYIRFGDIFIQEYFYYHVVNRALSSLEGHNGYPLLFIDILFNWKLFVSGVLLLLSIIFVSLRYKLKVIENFYLFLSIIGVILPLIIISLVQTKIAWYIFYVYPFACIVIGKFISDTLSEKSNPYLKLLGIFSLLIILGQVGRTIFLITQI